MSQLNKKIIWSNLGVVGLFIVDRILKWFSINFFPDEGYFIIPNISGLVIERNQGIAYSILLPQNILLLLVISIIFVLVAFLVKSYRKQEIEVIISISLIISGAISNLIDRINFGYVIDMIVLTSWPVFNIADIMILAGAVWLIINYWKTKKLVK